jgi:hypothetical protein
MRFYARPNIDKYECLLLGDENEQLIGLRAPEDSVDFWATGFIRALKDEGHWQECLFKLAQQVDQLPHCEVYGELHEETLPSTFLRVMCALAKALESPEIPDLPWREGLQESVRRFLQSNTWLNFRAFCHGDAYYYGVIVQGDPHQHYFKGQKGETCIPVELWSLWLDDERVPREIVQGILRNHDLLDETVHQQAKLPNSDGATAFLLHSYGSLSKALIKLLDETQDRDLITFRRKTIPALCGTVIRDEHDDLEEQKVYLERIFGNRDLKPDDRYDVLHDIFDDLQKDAEKRPENKPRLTTLTSAITQYYLKQYDLNRATGFWRLLMNKKDLLLRGILTLYRKPYLYAGIGLIWTVVTLIPGVLPDEDWVVIGASLVASSLLAITFGMTALYVLWILLLFFTLQGLDYVDLFLPRLFGAVAVGLSILAFENTAWNISLQLKGLNWVLLCVATYILSFVYVFIDVHKATRLLPLASYQPVRRQVHESPRITLNRLRADNPIKRSLRTSWRVFSIGLFEAFTASLITSTILATAVRADWINELVSNCLGFKWHWGPVLFNTLVDMDLGFLGFSWQWGQMYSFVFFPRLVLLWTGLALLIGAFAQLLWQDQRITSS